MGKPSIKGRSNHGGKFTQLHEFMMQTEAWRSLSPAERAVYVEVARVYSGSNNGFLARSVRQLADLTNINKDTAGRCLVRLQDRGFLECATPGGFSRKTPHAAEWRLTQHKCDKTGAPPTKLFLKWSAQIQKPVRNEGQTVRIRGTVIRLPEANCPKPRDGKPHLGDPIGPLVPDTYTSSHRRVVA